MSGLTSFFKLFKQAVRGETVDATSGSLDKVIFLLAIPMIFEMFMESLFAVVDIFFVSRIGTAAVAIVGLSESLLTIVYTAGFGLSMGATALVARRIGEKNKREASVTAVQAIYLGLGISLLISFVGFFFSEHILVMMGASPHMIETGGSYTKWMLTGNFVIVLLFLINGVFRGAGDAGIAMRSLWIANGINIILDPLFIFGIGFFPELGVKGAAVATTIGRSCGVLYQLYFLFNGRSIIQLKGNVFQIKSFVISKLLRLSAGTAGQFLIASASWIFLMRIMSAMGEQVLAGYTTAIRILVFTILPAWGISNAAATAVGQNLGAGLPERAEKSVWRTAYFNMIFMGIITVIFELFPVAAMHIFTHEPAVVKEGVLCLRIVCMGYIVYGYEMVLANAFNGAGDSRTPTIVNFFGFWIFQIPFAWFLSGPFGLHSTGVYLAVPVTESFIAVTFIVLFKKGKWKSIHV